MLIDKLSCKWVSIKTPPKSGFNTLVFTGGIPKLPRNCFYMDGKWWNSHTHEEIKYLSDDSCWLQYSHSDYPKVKF